MSRVISFLKSLKEAGVLVSEFWYEGVRYVLAQDGSPVSSPARDIQDELAKHFANGRF